MKKKIIFKSKHANYFNPPNSCKSCTHPHTMQIYLQLNLNFMQKTQLTAHFTGPCHWQPVLYFDFESLFIYFLFKAKNELWESVILSVHLEAESENRLNWIEWQVLIFFSGAFHWTSCAQLRNIFRKFVCDQLPKNQILIHTK